MTTKDNIVVVGDLMLDRRIEAEMTRISPSAQPHCAFAGPLPDRRWRG